VRRLIDSAHLAAHNVLTANRVVLDRLASELILHETLETERVQALFAEVVMWNAPAAHVDDRASVRPEGAPLAPTRSTTAAASQPEQPHRRPGAST
jgi:hypothetical protein